MKIARPTEIESDERTSGTRLYVVLGVSFIALVIAGIFTVALPELRNDPDATPDAGVRAPPPAPPS